MAVRVSDATHIPLSDEPCPRRQRLLDAGGELFDRGNDRFKGHGGGFDEWPVDGNARGSVCDRRSSNTDGARLTVHCHSTAVFASLDRSASEPKSHRVSARPAKAPNIWAAMNAGTSTGRIPAKVSDRARAIVMAGFAKDVEAVNQYAAPIHAGTRHAACLGFAHDNTTVIRPADATVSESNCPSPALACVPV